MGLCLIRAGLRVYRGVMGTDQRPSISMVHVYPVNQMEHLGDQARMQLLSYTATMFFSPFGG
jgi:hypothetical protein